MTQPNISDKRARRAAEHIRREAEFVRLEEKHALLEAEHARFEARCNLLAAKYYQAQADYERAKQQCEQLATVARAKQYVIETLLPKHPDPVPPTLQQLIELPYNLAA